MGNNAFYPCTAEDPLGLGPQPGLLGAGAASDIAGRPAPGQGITYSQAVTASELVNIPVPVGANLAWDSYWRAVYEKANKLIQQQANQLLQRGNVTAEEAKELIEVQRNRLVIEMRKPLTPFGRFYSEVLKPEKDLPTLEQLLKKKGSIEAVLNSVGKTRAFTNRLAIIGRSAGPAGIVLEVVVIGVVIEKADPHERARVATEEIGGAAGGFMGGRYGMLGGAAAGAAWAGTWASPTLLIPVVGEITEGGAVLIGGIVGGLLGAWVGHDVSKEAVHQVWMLSEFYWKTDK